MASRRPGPAAILLAAASVHVLAGCASYTNVALEVRDPLARGDAAAAEAFLVDKKPGGDGLPYLMELGLVLREGGQLDRSNETFESAELRIDELFTRSVSKEALAFLTSDETIPYDGEMWERVLVHYYRAMNYVDLGRYDDALVECRKINHRLKVWTDAEEDPPTYATDAFAQYLTALLYEAGGDLNDAWVSLRLADSAYVAYESAYGVPAPVSLKRDMLRLAKRMDLPDDARRLRERWPDVEPPTDEQIREQGEVIVFWEEGFIPAKVQRDIVIPILKGDDHADRVVFARTLSGRVVAHPVYDDAKLDYLLRIAVPDYPPPDPGAAHGWARLTAGEASAKSEIAEDLDAIARQGLQDRMGRILFRTILRALAKYAVSRGVEAKKGETAGIIANLFTALTEKADTRAWITLPRAIHIVRVFVPPGEHQLTLECHAAGVTETVTFDAVRVGAGEVRFLSHRTY